MKNFIKTLTYAALLCGSLAYAQLALSETGLHKYNGITKAIVMIDKKKKLIEVGSTVFAYDDNTKILSVTGKQVTVDQLLVDDFVTIKMNTSQRYLGYPLLSQIFIETIHYD